jgi:glycosyltransferase involved in cell wall biosynthesis
MAVGPAARFVIVTPAFNEGSRIDETAQHVVAQTIKPLRWIIVDDGSTDETAARVQALHEQFPWIVYHRRSRDPSQAYFASNVYAIMAGVERLRDLDYEYLAVLDADITLSNDYYEQILARFDADPRLGVASGIYEDLIDGQPKKVLMDPRSTPKAIQVFRRSCFEDIGGYLPLTHGGEDTCSCVMARMQGWKSWSFPELKVLHRRPTGAGNARSVLRVRFVQGLCEYALGAHPLFMIVKAIRRSILEPPRGLSGSLRLAGYVYGYLRREPRQVPPHVVRYARQEQLSRVFRLNAVPRDARLETDTV